MKKTESSKEIKVRRKDEDAGFIKRGRRETGDRTKKMERDGTWRWEMSLLREQNRGWGNANGNGIVGVW